MAYSTQTAVSDGTLESLPLTIEYIDRENITVIVDLNDGEGPKEYAPGTIWDWVGTEAIQFEEPLPDGAVVVLRRATEVGTLLNKFTTGAMFNAPTLDENFDQMLFLVQEAREGAGLTGVFNALNMHGFRIQNLGDGIDDRDAASIGQVRDLVRSSPELQRTLRVAREEEPLAQLPGPEVRGGKLLAFDSAGRPTVAAPVEDSATDVRLDLADPAKGAAIVARAPVCVDTVADLLALPEGQKKAGVQYLVKEYSAGSGIGGGEFYWDASKVGENDGGVVLSGFVRKDVDGAVDASWFGVVADFNGAAGTDNSLALQKAIDYFGTARGIAYLPAGRLLFAGSVDFKRVGLVGVGPNGTYQTGMTQLNFVAPYGLYTSIADNRAPEHKRFMISSADTRSLNGQTLVDLTGLNYPKLKDILIYGGEVGLKLSNGGGVESHYGAFYDVDISRSYYGILVTGGRYTQSHNFHGGRVWDCVEGYVNAEGTSDINFHGTIFESDVAAVHRNAGDNPDAAQTKMFGGRDECDRAPDIQAGALHQFGTYWSGNRQAEYQTLTAAGINELDIQVIIEGVRNNVSPVGTNLLKNAGFAPNPANPTAAPTGWTIAQGNLVAVEKGAFGNVLHIEGIDGTNRTFLLTQAGVSVKKGFHTWGIKYYTTGGTGVFTTELTDNGVALVQGVDFEGTAVTTTAGGKRVLTVKFLRDIPNLRFRASVVGLNAGEHIAFEQPFILPGRSSTLWVESQPTGVRVTAASEMPTYGHYVTGDIVWNSAPVRIGAAGSRYIVTGWKRLTTGAGHVLDTDWVEMRAQTGD